MKKKYRLLENDTITVGGRTLYRIEALRDFANVKKGDKGGFVESEKNLSHEGNCRVYDDACVDRRILKRLSSETFTKTRSLLK